MDDDNSLKSPKWIRAHSYEKRMEWAKIPKVFAETAGKAKGHPEVNEWVSNYERGSVLVLRSRNTIVPAHLASSALDVLASTFGESVRWVTAQGYIEMYKEEWDEEDSSGPRWRALKYINRAFDVVVIDNLDAKGLTDYEKKVIGSLIAGRTERGLTTIITTPNLPADFGVYGGRVGHYVMEGTEISCGR